MRGKPRETEMMTLTLPGSAPDSVPASKEKQEVSFLPVPESLFELLLVASWLLQYTVDLFFRFAPPQPWKSG